MNVQLALPRIRTRLSPQQLAIVSCLSLRTEQIAERFHMKPRTVEKNIQMILDRLDVVTRTEAVVIALRIGLLTIEDCLTSDELEVS